MPTKTFLLCHFTPDSSENYSRVQSRALSLSSSLSKSLSCSSSSLSSLSFTSSSNLAEQVERQGSCQPGCCRQWCGRPAENIEWLDWSDLISYENIVRLAWSDLSSDENIARLDLSDLLSAENITRFDLSDLSPAKNINSLDLSVLLPAENITRLDLSDLLLAARNKIWFKMEALQSFKLNTSSWRVKTKCRIIQFWKKISNLRIVRHTSNVDRNQVLADLKIYHG